MFTGELAESRQTEVTIRDIDELAMDLLIDFCYTSHIVVEESNVQTLLPAACLLQLTEIQVSNHLKQGSPNYGPRATSGLHENSFYRTYFLLQIKFSLLKHSNFMLNNY